MKAFKAWFLKRFFERELTARFCAGYSQGTFDCIELRAALQDCEVLEHLPKKTMVQ